jgi:hypothetical protein
MAIYGRFPIDGQLQVSIGEVAEAPTGGYDIQVPFLRRNDDHQIF